MRAERKAKGLCIHPGCSNLGEIKENGQVAVRCHQHKQYQKRYMRCYHTMYIKRKAKLLLKSLALNKETK